MHVQLSVLAVHTAVPGQLMVGGEKTASSRNLLNCFRETLAQDPSETKDISTDRVQYNGFCPKDSKAMSTALEKARPGNELTHWTANCPLCLAACMCAGEGSDTFFHTHHPNCPGHGVHVLSFILLKPHSNKPFFFFSGKETANKKSANKVTVLSWVHGREATAL